MCVKTAGGANSVDPDQTFQNVASDLGQHCARPACLNTSGIYGMFHFFHVETKLFHEYFKYSDKNRYVGVTVSQVTTFPIRLHVHQAKTDQPAHLHSLIKSLCRVSVGS